MKDRRLQVVFGLNLLAVLVVGGMVAGLLHYYQDRFLPGTSIAGINVSGLSTSVATQKLHQELALDDLPSLKISSGEASVASSASELKLAFTTEATVDQVWQNQQSPTWFGRLRQFTNSLINDQATPIPVTFDQAAIQTMITDVANQADQPGKMAIANLAYTNAPGSLTVSSGEIGSSLNQALTFEMVSQRLVELQPSTQGQLLPTLEFVALQTQDGQHLDEAAVAAAKTRATALVGKTVELSAGDLNLRLSDQDLVKLLSFPTGVDQTQVATITAQWATRVNRPAQDAVFEYDATALKVTTFQPPRDGLALDLTQAAAQINQVIAQIESDVAAAATFSAETKPALSSTYTAGLTVATTPPNKTLASTNDLGIAQRIGFGDSEYAHSIPTRVHNVALAASRINNYIIKPGEEFFFNRALGEVSRATGFQPAYVIQSGKTVLGDGGGVCQVSTTVFRAALNAGLPITKRKAHSYRVSYYELDRKPGVDATVYSGDVDLRFMNDTGHHILIHTETDSDNLYMKVEMYGTSDGRTAEIVDHKTWDYRSPPAPVYIPDPSLPPGRVKQIDWAASGIKASFKNVVKDKNGQVIREDEYFSNYVPWSAKYLRGV